jgi:hypothetical protein
VILKLAHESVAPEACLIANVVEVTAAACTAVRAVVLTGSMARGEASWIEQNNRLRLRGDAEFLLIFRNRAKLPRAEQISQLSADVESLLSDAGIDAHIGLSPVEESYLYTFRPHIFAYELIVHGKVVAGDSDILRLARRFDLADIPFEDGFSLLMNRIIELIEALCGGSAGQSDRARYCILKLWLDMATSYLLFKGGYEPSYRARAARLREMAESRADAPIPIAYFADSVESATSIKLGIQAETIEDASLASLVSAVRALWRWQLQHLTGMSLDATDAALRRRWSQAQAIRERLRGWASAVKRSSELRNTCGTMKWIHLFKGSPRRIIYSVASELFFSIPETHLVNESPADRVRWNSVRRQLPIATYEEDNGGSAWQQLGIAIARNYHELLEATRS